MPEIVLLCEYPTLNGGERSMLATLEHVRAAGFSPVVMAPPEGPLAEELATRSVEMIPLQCRVAQPPSAVPEIVHGRGRPCHISKCHMSKCHISKCHISKCHISKLPLARLRAQLERTLVRRRPALLHANSLSMGRLSGPVAARLRLPSVAHLRDIVRLSARAAADLNCHTRLLAVSRATRDFHLSHGISAEKTHVLYNGVDLDEFHPRPPSGYLHRELALPADAKLIGAIGQLGLRKGQDVLLSAAAAISTQAAMVHYLIVGERNSDKEESRRFERDLHAVSGGPLAGRVHFLGRRGDVATLLNELTLVVHPARQEPLGRVLLEAAASGTAVVATAVGGTAEIFPPAADAARLVPPDDSPALAAALLELLADAPLRRRIAAAARLRAEAAFDARSAAKNLIKHYRAVIDGPQSPNA